MILKTKMNRDPVTPAADQRVEVLEILGPRRLAMNVEAFHLVLHAKAYGI